MVIMLWYLPLITPLISFCIHSTLGFHYFHSALAHRRWRAKAARSNCGSSFGKFPTSRHYDATILKRRNTATSSSTSSLHAAPLSEADKDRLLFGEVGLTAFIVAEMRHFVNETMVELDQGLRYGIKWSMSLEDKIHAGLADENGTLINLEYAQFYCNSNSTATTSTTTTSNTMDGTMAVDLICNATQIAFVDGFRQQGLLSALGSAILYFRSFFRTPTLLAACERVGLSDYAVAHHITDMYHHRTLRGTYTKTLAPSGKGEIAAAIAVGLAAKQETTNLIKQPCNDTTEAEAEIDDECLLWSPTTPGVCLHWKSEDDAWRKKRFERIQMEGTRDPRRGGSGTTR